MANLKILFIAWDGPYVSYLESLFLPIFHSLKECGIEFHIIQFSWASANKVRSIKTLCDSRKIPFTHYNVSLNPHPAIGKFLTLAAARSKISKYLKKEDIHILMPRGLMPASVALRVLGGSSSLRLIYDADGLQIEERVDFAGLKVGSMRYKQLKNIERRIVAKADVILTRSLHAIDFLVQQYGEDKRQKISRVLNGRDEYVFKRSPNDERSTLRKELKIPEDAFVSVYCGSLAPQYGLPEMAKLHSLMLKNNQQSYWLVLTANIDEMHPYLNMPNVIVRTVAADEVPKYLSIGNVGLALRNSTFSMKGVAPIKLGEYLLIGLPIIASAGIGDTEKLLADLPFCYLLPNFSDTSLQEAIIWMSENNNAYLTSDIRAVGLNYFSLSAAVENYQKAIQSL
jgi:hypothetical protein